ncbi:MAG: preprotein translocase subunit SecY [Leptospirales bacterium]
MLKILTTIFSIPDLRRKVIFSLSMIVVFRFGAHVTVPGIDNHILAEYMKLSAGDAPGLTDLIDIFSGGAFKRLSLFALGIMPYISASIIMQLLMVVVPSLQKLQKEGEQGRKKVNQYTRYGTVILCAAQSYGLTIHISSLHDQVLGKMNADLISGGGGIGFVLMTMLAITTGTIVLMWIGEMITERGIGNGISLLIFAGIIAGAPTAIKTFAGDIASDQVEAILAVILVVVFLAMIALSILLTEGTRKVPVQYGKKIVGRKMMQGASQSLPIKVNAANVMPIIFASSILMLPTYMAGFLKDKYPDFAGVVEGYLTMGTISYMVTFVILIIFFAYFYTAIQYNPKDLAEALKKNGGYVPGIRPGAQTEEFLSKILNRITLSGAIFLAFIAISPDIIIKIWDLQKYRSMAALFGGTSLLIIVGVALDTLKQIESQLVMRHYDGFMDRSKKQLKRPKIVR